MQLNISRTFLNDVLRDNMNRMFAWYAADSKSPIALDLSSFATQNVVDMDFMFEHTQFKTIYVSDSWNTNNVTNHKNMFGEYEEGEAVTTQLQGGNGTKLNSEKLDKTRAVVDNRDNKGYLTYKSPVSAENPDSCSITYELDGGKTPEGSVAPYAQQVKQGTEFTVQGSVADGKNNQITDPEKDDYKFLGWSTEEGAAAAKYTKEQAVVASGSEMKLYAVWGQSYTGTVVVRDENGGAGSPVQGATVTFTPSSGTAVTTATDNNGKFTFDKSGEEAYGGTPGTINITYTGGEGKTDTYSDNPKTTTSSSVAALGEFTIRKLNSLAVKVYNSNTGLKETFWCPAFSAGSLTKSNIIFYDNNRCEVNGSFESDTTKYQMSDLYYKSGSSIQTKIKSNYYAFTAPDTTLKCYQTADTLMGDIKDPSSLSNAGWDSVFQEKSSETSYPKFGELKSDFSMSNFCSDPTAKLVYFDGSNDAASWTTNVKEKTVSADCPTLNDNNYSVQDGVSGWLESYGDSGGGIFSSKCSYPWSNVAYDSFYTTNGHAYYWDTSKTPKDAWNNYQERHMFNFAIVLAQTFSNSAFGVSATVDDSSHGSIEGSALSNIPCGTTYKVDGEKITVGSGSEASFTFKPVSASFKLVKWVYSSDGGTSWTDLGSTTGVITGNTVFKAVTTDYVSLKSNDVQYWPVFDATNPLPAGVTFFAKKPDGSYAELTGWATMADLKSVYDSKFAEGETGELCFTNNGTTSFTCVASINETYDKAFGSSESGVADSPENNKAKAYIGDFADKVNANCVPLTSAWYCLNTDSSKYTDQGKYGPGVSFDFSKQESLNEPLINKVGINSIDAAYILDSEGKSKFWSCVSANDVLLQSAWFWFGIAPETISPQWSGNMRLHGEHAVAFSRYFGGDHSVSFDAGTVCGDTVSTTMTGMSNGDKIVLPGQGDITPPSDSYVFNGWNTAKDGSGTGYAAGDEYSVPEVQTTTLYAQWKEIFPYTGTVKIAPENSENEPWPLEGATVTFTPKNSNVISSVSTDASGKFTFNGGGEGPKVFEGTAGKITISYSDNPEDYSDDPLETTTQSQASLPKTFVIRKLSSSLAVKVWQTSLETYTSGLQQTFWCPAFDEP